MAELTPESRQAEELDGFMFELDQADEQGWPAGPVKQELVAEVPTAEIVAQLLGVTFGLIATKAGEHWALSEDEANVAGEAYGAVIDKYFPDAGQYMGVEVTALLITGGLIMPRLIMSKQKKIEASPVVVEEENAKPVEVENVNGGFGAVDEMRSAK